LKNRLLTLTLAFFAITAGLFTACYKSAVTDSATPGNPNHIPPDQTVIASLQGRVIDEKGVPVQGASVSSGGVGTTTDVNGLFSFTKINMSSRFGYVKVAKTGYFTGSRSIITNGASSNYVNIQLIPRTETSVFQAPTGGTIVVQTGDSAVFPAASIVTESTNAAYSGNVHVFTKYLDPTDPNLYKYMPGDLRGIGSDGSETALESFGMLLVELQGDAGEKLQLAPGHTATLTWAIPASLQNAAPATIPLWYFNDTTGRWIQQGAAARQGNSYVGQVSHFSFWNCDAGVGTVNFKVRLKDQHGNPVAYTYVRMVSQNWGAAGGFTDSSGFVQGLIPKGQTLTMQVITECGNMLGGANVGPALTDQDLGTITVTLEYSDITLTGKVVNCSGNLIDSGIVNVLIDGLNYRANVTKGLFSLPVNRCFSTTVPVVLTGYDFATAASGADTLMASSGTVDAGQITVCSTSSSESINFTVGGSTYHILAPPDNISYVVDTYDNATEIFANTAGTYSPALSIQLPTLTGPGNYTMDSVYASTATGSYIGANLSCTISSYGPVNSNIIGSFSGSVLLNYSGQPQPITGSFSVIRTQ
jgi:hypothetical protein